MSTVIAILLFLGVPGMVAGYFAGGWMGEARWSWRQAIPAGCALGFASGMLTVVVLGWGAGGSGPTGEAVRALLQRLAFGWNLVAVWIATLVGFRTAPSRY